ncbi:PVC-type heme-binding CxxCH protein [Prosthecobacter sp.]|uniref:PVC-type heme-binding CxxCH protein n=1 Tax=Prosthecobacter sp. TaxID=1965333 RepID=UPI00378371DF
MKRILSLLLLATALHAEPVSLFDGKTLDGWDFDPKIWRVEDGMITGGSTTEKIKENHFICTKKNYANFELKLKIKVSGDPKTGMLNSGIQIRSLRVPGGAHMTGYQVDCGAGWFGKIYDEFRRNKVIWAPTPEQQAALDKAVDVFGWNEYRIRAEGPRIQTWINGVLCIDYTETDKNIALDGLIGPQVHSGGVCLVQVKDVTIEELPPTPDAPTWEKLGGVDAARKLVAPPAKPQADAAAPTKRDISYNNVQGSALTAQEQLKKFHVADGYEIELVVQESDGVGKFVSVYFDQRGRMWTQTAFEYPVDANENPAAAEAVYAARGKDKVLVYPRESVNAPIPAGGLTNPTVFADGLAIPLGILPWGNGDSCYVLHGHDLLLMKDTNNDGKADQREVILTGFGVQDSHLFPHQFTRAPGGWIWMAQGLFNNSKVHKPGSDVVVDYPKCGMARMRPDGSEFEMTSVGPNNIWGLVMTGEGETFIQEANDYGYPIMPFHEYAYYPGGMEALKKSYQPDFPPAAEFRMGGTGLSGLALMEGGVVPGSPEPAKAGTTIQKPDLTMAVANPIISKVQTIGMHRDGAYWKLEQLTDLLTCDDPFFRPVGLTNGPDGCIYIVDWYNKIISHNEVPRAHPDRDKTRGRIWRVKPKGAKGEVPDFTNLGSDELSTSLKDGPIGRRHLAWQTLVDRKALPATHWASSEYAFPAESVRLRMLGRSLSIENIGELLSYAKPSLPGPLGQSSRGAKQIPVREAYDREFERFLVRLFLERQPDVVAKFLDSDAAAKLPVEAGVLASLALEPKASASRVAKLLPQLDRAPNDEELLRLAQFPDEAGCGDALKALLANPKSRAAVVEKLLAHSTKLEPAKIAPFLKDAARALLKATTFSKDAAIQTSARTVIRLRVRDQDAFKDALQLISRFNLAEVEAELVAALKETADKNGLKDMRLPMDDATALLGSEPDSIGFALAALAEMKSDASDLFLALTKAPYNQISVSAIVALASSKNPKAPGQYLQIYSSIEPAVRRPTLSILSSSKTGAKAIVGALLDKSLPQADLDGPTVERLATVLGADPALEKLQQQLGGVFREVLLLDGEETAWVDSKITLDGPYTVETWVRLAPGIGNQDDLLGVPGGCEMNFFQSKFRVFGGPQLHDVVVATKPMTPDLWTHIAVTRDAQGICRIYQNGELDATASKPAPLKWENCRIGWSGPKGGTEGVMTEFRVWNRERTAQEIRANFDRIVVPNTAGASLVFSSAEKLKAELKNAYGKGARIAKTIDTPPLLTEEQAKALDAKFERFTALAPKGNAANGKALSALCMACHQIGNAGGQIGPNLSGAGAMGLEAVLRNILTPNAAMEPGYRIYRVEMKNGDLIDAFFVSEDKDATVIRQPGLPDRRLEKKEIRSTKFIRRSLMPEGLLDALQDQQVADLLAYLMTLKG